MPAMLGLVCVPVWIDPESQSEPDTGPHPVVNITDIIQLQGFLCVYIEICACVCLCGSSPNRSTKQDICFGLLYSGHGRGNLLYETTSSRQPGWHHWFTDLPLLHFVQLFVCKVAHLLKLVLKQIIKAGTGNLFRRFVVCPKPLHMLAATYKSNTLMMKKGKTDICGTCNPLKVCLFY